MQMYVNFSFTASNFIINSGLYVSVVDSLSTPTNRGANAKMFLSASTVSFLLKKLIYFITNVCYLPLHICIKLLEPPKKLSQM